MKSFPTLDVLSSLGKQTFGWMGMYVPNPPDLSRVYLIIIILQGIWERNDEYADGDHVA